MKYLFTTIASLSLLLLLAQCNKNDDGGGCFSDLTPHVDSIKVPQTAKLNDSVEIVIYVSSPTYCYTNLQFSGNTDDKTISYTGNIQYNSCIDCIQTPKKFIHRKKFLADKTGNWQIHVDSDLGSHSGAVDVQP